MEEEKYTSNLDDMMSDKTKRKKIEENIIKLIEKGGEEKEIQTMIKEMFNIEVSLEDIKRIKVNIILSPRTFIILYRLIEIVGMDNFMRILEEIKKGPNPGYIFLAIELRKRFGGDIFDKELAESAYLLLQHQLGRKPLASEFYRTYRRDFAMWVLSIYGGWQEFLREIGEIPLEPHQNHNHQDHKIKVVEMYLTKGEGIENTDLISRWFRDPQLLEEILRKISKKNVISEEELRSYLHPDVADNFLSCLRRNGMSIKIGKEVFYGSREYISKIKEIKNFVRYLLSKSEIVKL